MIEINYLLFARGVRAIFLINNDGIADMVHENVFIYEIGSPAERRRSPRFDSHSIGSTVKGAVFDDYSPHIIFVSIFSEAADAYPMPGSTNNVRNMDLCSPGQHGYTIVASADCGTRDSDAVWVSNFDPVGVGTVAGSQYSDITDVHILTTIYHKMIVLAVNGPQVMNPGIGHKIKSHCLRSISNKITSQYELNTKLDGTGRKVCLIQLNMPSYNWYI